jgi:hypothetical protein
VCGPNSAIGLEHHERERWDRVREHLREPGQLVGLMRGFLADHEVAAVVTTTPQGAVRPLAVLVSPTIEAEMVLPESTADGWVDVELAGYPVQAYLEPAGDRSRPLAVRMTPWMHEYLVLYARRLFGRRR